ncbi:TPA: hypothetical protein ACGCAJ_004758 [Serratia marcescens]
MSWTYCGRCDNGVDAPTPRQVVENAYTCPHCGKDLEPNMTLGDVVLTLIERVEALESKNGEKDQ